jgi:hypothetical protein
LKGVTPYAAQSKMEVQYILRREGTNILKDETSDKRLRNETEK